MTEQEKIVAFCKNENRQVWRIGSLIEILKSDEAPAMLGIHYESWPGFAQAVDDFKWWAALSGGDITEEGENLRKLCHALSDFLRSVLEGAEKPDGIPGFFGYDLVQHEDGWIEVEEGVYHIWTLGARQRLWIRVPEDTAGSPVVDNIGNGILRLSIPYAIWKGQSFKVEVI